MAGQPSGMYRDRNSTADRALDILLMYDDDRPTVSGTDVAARLGVARSTAYRYLQSLASSGFVEDAGGGRGFRLGPRVLELARLARRGLGLSEVARPVMRGLVEQTGETALLTRRSGRWVVCLEQEEPRRAVRLSYERGHMLPANAGASALALLAWAPQEEIDAVLGAEELPRYTEATVTDPVALRHRLALIREHGFAITRGELDPDVVGVAAPIRGAGGEVAAALSVVGLAHRMPDGRVPSVLEAVTAAAHQVADKLTALES